MGSGDPLSGRAELVRLELDDHNYLAGPAASVASFLKMGRGQSPSDILPIEGDKVHYVAHIDNILIFT